MRELLRMIVRWGRGADTASRSMTAAYLDTQPHLLGKWASLNPMGRIGRPDELRGVVTWLASDASTFCTGSEYVKNHLEMRGETDQLYPQYPSQWRSSRLVMCVYTIFPNCEQTFPFCTVFLRSMGPE